jgi:hypothetical protein
LSSQPENWKKTGEFQASFPVETAEKNTNLLAKAHTLPLLKKLKSKSYFIDV